MTTTSPGSERASWETSKAARRIMSAAVEVFSEQGYGGTSTRDIARYLELSPAAMYPHFDSKENLLFAVAVDGHRRAMTVVGDAADSAARSQAERLAATVAAFARWQVENRALARVVQYEIRSLTAEHYREVNELRRLTSNIIESIITAGVDSAEFTCTNIADVTLAITSLCVDISRWFPSARHNDGDTLASSYADIATSLVRPSPSIS